MDPPLNDGDFPVITQLHLFNGRYDGVDAGLTIWPIMVNQYQDGDFANGEILLIPDV